jgi:pimeloyl-ACP methyl ester carboxylesterase
MMNNNKIHIIIIIFLLLAFLVSCSGAPTKQLPTETATATATPKPTVQLTPCRIGYRQAQCGSLQVYEDREAQSGRMIPLKIVVFPALNDQPAPDPIFYLSGGPGGAAASEDANYQQFSAGLYETHDIVFVDQRGTGGSNEVLIPTDQPDMSGFTPEQMDTAAKAWVAKVLGEIDMDPRFYTTSVAMDDLDEVREALGYDKIDVVGCSYGATAAQYYLRQHEEHVRSIALCVGSLLDIPVFERWAANTQRALDQIFNLCMADSACQSAYPNLKAEFTGLMDRLAAQPETAPYPESGNAAATITYDVDFFSGSLRNLMKDAQNDRLVPLYIHLAYGNDWSGFNHFIARGGGPEWWGQQFMDHIIRCSEKWSAFDPAAVAQLGQGSFMLTRDVNLAQSTALSCIYTPAGITPEGIYPQAGSQVPVMIWNGNLDPIDPPENTAGAQILFPNSVSLVAPYQAHAISGQNSACFNSILEQFIETGTAKGLDTSCLQKMTPPAFDLR